MRRNFTSPSKFLFATLTSLFLVNNQTAFSQECTLAANPAACTDAIAEDFTSPASTTAFGSLQFVRTAMGPGDFFLSAPTPTDATVSLFTTNTYTVPNATNTIITGFMLRSNSNFINSFTVDILSPTGTVLATCTRTTLQPGANRYYCISITDPDLVEGTDFRIQFSFLAEGGNNRSVDFDDFSVGGFEQTPPLPVEFISFDAKRAENGILLIWNVGSEVNVERYEIERSTDGAKFEKIGAIPATQSSSYSFTDQQPLSGTSYYRVRNVDFDGKYAYTSVVKYGNGQAEMLFKAFPTSTKGLVTFQHPIIRENGAIIISSLEGKTLLTLIPTRGTMSTKIDFSPYPSGTYLLRFQGENSRSETFRIFKQ